MLWHFDPMYLLLVVLPGMVISGVAAMRVKSAFAHYSQVPTENRISGAEAAQVLLHRAGIDDVQVVPTRGYLSDHYDPMNRRLALSEGVYSSTSVAAVGIACHEAGHAIQHAEHYAPLNLRSALVPTAGIGSNLGVLVMGLGLFMNAPKMILIGAVLFSAVLLFQLVTLPVEFDASNRAKHLIVEAGIIRPDERVGVDAVLNAAAWTYVAAAVTTVLTLAYYLFHMSQMNRDE